MEKCLDLMFFLGIFSPIDSSDSSIIDACVTSNIPLRLRRALTSIFDGVPSGCA